jgi:hypothetical protein
MATVGDAPSAQTGGAFVFLLRRRFGLTGFFSGVKKADRQGLGPPSALEKKLP